MKKHVQSLLLLAALLLPWAMQAQGVSGCAFTTGVDNTKWVTLSSAATEITAIYDDDAPSSCINIGFNFYFGGNIYTQFSCNSNGRFRLGPTAVSNYWSNPFTTLTSANNDLPFVTAFGADNTLAGTGVYCKYELVGTAPNRILVVEYLTPSEYSTDGDLVNYQIQLVEDSNRVRLVYGTTAATTYDGYQIGIANTATDFLMVNAATHATLTTPTSFTNDSWPGAGRYYEFTMGMPPACPGITSIAVGDVTVGNASLSWTHGAGTPASYEIEYYVQGDMTTLQTTTSTTPNIVLTGLDSNTTYVVRVRAYCGTDGYGLWDSTTFTTNAFGCIYDPTSIHTFTSGTGTSQTTGVPVNSSWGNTLCQGIYTAAELLAAGFPSTGADITDLTFTWTNNSSYAKYFTIYMVNTTKDVFGGTSATEWVSTGASAKVYEGDHPLNTSGAVTYHLTTPFHWDGSSNICVTTTMNQPSGASHSSSSFYGYSTTLSSYYRTLYKYQDSSPLDGSNPAATAASSRSYYRTNITFKSQTCVGLATCAAPVVQVDSMTSDEAYLSWIPGYDETSWDVEYRVKGTTTWMSASTGVSSTSLTVMALNPATYYEFRVLTICSTDTFASATVEGLTECVPVANTALPYTYGFEDLTSTGSGTPLNLCWDRGYLSGSTFNGNSYPYASTTCHTGTRSIYFYAYSTTTRSWACLPEFEDSVNTLRLQFWAKKSSTSYSGQINVGVMTDPHDFTTYQNVATLSTDATTNWQHFETGLSSAPGTGYITIMVDAGSTSSNYMYVDDITVDLLPFCTTPVVDSVLLTTTSADIYLSDITNASDIVVTLTAGTWDTTVVEYASPVAINDLTPGVTYSYSIKTHCTNGDSSDVRTGTFTTICAPIEHDNLPFTYGFEDITTTGSGIPLAPCWDRGYLNGSTFYSNSYPYASSSYYHTGSRSLYFYASGTTVKSWLCLPEFEDSLYTLRLKFWAMKSSTSYSGQINVGVMTDPHNFSTYQNLRTLTTNNTTSWQQFEVSLSQVSATGYITIMVDAGSTSSNYMYVDDITVEELPFCTTPVVDSVLLTTTSAELYLSDIDNASDIVVTLTAGTWDTTIVDYNATISIYDLAPGTTYNYSIITNCTNSDVSGVCTGSFSTVCAPIAHDDLPLNYGFEDLTSTGSGTPIRVCWDRGYLSSGTFNANNYPYASSSYYHTGNRALYFYGNSTTTRSWLCLPEFEDSLYTLQLTFWGMKTSTSYNGRIIVGVMTDPHTSSTFQPLDTVTISSANTWTHFEVPLDNAPGAGYITIMDLPGSSSNYLYVDDIHVDEIPTCLTPTGLAASNITLSSADLAWNTRTGSETSWLIGVNGYETEVNDSTTTVTGLRPSSDNTVTLRAVCGAGDTSEMAYITITTLCGIVPPFHEDFESYTTYSSSSSSTPFIPCWTRLNNGTSYGGVPYVGSSSYNHTLGGAKGLYWYGSTTATTYGDYYYCVLPMLDTANYQINTLRVKFWAKASSTSYHPIVRVGVMTDPTDVTTFQAVNSNIAINPGSSTAWTEFSVDLSSYTGNGAYIAIGALRPTSTWYMYMDDISVIQIPDCDGVSNIALTGVTTSTATLNWTENGTATSWEVEYGPAGFPRGAGTTATVTAVPYTITGLNANTQYDIYVAPTCTGVPEEVQYTFRTECTPLVALPYSMGFETSDGVTSVGSSTTTTWVDCWHRLNNGTMYFGYPYVGSSTTYAHSGSRGLYWYNYTTTGTYGDYQIVVLPCFDTTSYFFNNLMLSFWAKTSGTTATLQVGVMTNPLDPASFQQVSTVTVGNAAWERKDVSFEYFTGNGGYVAIRAQRASWTIYVDDITLGFLPDCPRVSNMHASNITTSQADLTWTENGSATEWNIIYGPTGFNPHSSTAIHETAYTLPHTLYGLNANTVYDVYVAPDCDGTTDTNMFSFRTECEAMTTLPYTMGFETSDGVTTTGSSTSDVFVNCWHRLNNGSMYFGFPYVSSSSTYNHTTGGTKGLYWYGSTTTGTYGDYQIVVLPAIDTDIYAINTLQFKFWAKSSSTSYYPSFQVGVMTDPYDNSTFQLVANVNVGNNTNWEEYTTVLGNFTGYGQYVALRALRPTSSWYAYVDDITLEQAPLCPAITEVSVNAVGTTSAHVSWTIQSGIQGVPSSYEVIVTPDQAGSTPLSFIAYQPQLLITGLTSNTGYDVEVRADCDYDGYGPWSDEASFITDDYPCMVYDPNGTIDTTIGTGTDDNSYIPSYGYYNYSLTQQIFTAAEIGGAITLTSIAMMPSAVASQRTYEIYLAHTSQSTLTGFIHPSDMVKVYNGAPCQMTANQWTTWTFDTPFAYNGTDNLLVCFRDMTGDYVSGTTWKVHSRTGGSVYVYQDGGSYDPYTYTGGTAQNYRNNAKFHGILCAQQSTCAPPLVVVDSVSEDEITVSWAAGADETSWDVDYRQGTSGNWTYEGNESSTTYTFSNLTPNTEYQIRITANCSDTDMASIITVRTPCAAVSIPYTQTFEGVPTGTSAAFPSCMHRINNGTSYGYYPYVSSSTSYNHTPGGSQGLYYYATTSTSTYGDYFVVVMPRVDVSENPINTLQLLFWGKPSSTSYAPSFEVGVLTDPEDISTYQQVSTVNFDHSTTDWQPYEISLSSYTGTGEYIALRGNRTSSTWYAYIDDISIEHAPACPRVGNITFRNITGNSATVAWTPTSADEYEVEYGPVGFTPGTGTRLQYIIDDSVDITGLYASTSYHVYVRGICTDDTSNWSFVSQFNTSCATLTLPFDENFDNYTTSTTSATGVTPLCWNYLMTNSSYSSSTYVPQLYYYSSDPGTYAHSGHYSLRLYGVSYTTLPALSDEDTSVTIGFWTKHSSTDYNLAVGVMSNPSDANTFVPVDTINYVGTSIPEYHEIDLAGHLGTAHYIAFRNWSASNYGYSYHYIDDISVWRNSTCPTPSYVRVDNVSNHNATVYWGDTSNGAYNNVRVFWGLINNIGAAIDSADVYSGNSYTLTGLTGNTTYYVWVYGQCMDDDSRALSTTFTTTLDCVPVDNVTVTTDYHAFNLSWDVPVGGEPVTGYVVEYKPASSSAWISATTTNTHYYVSGLTANTLYDYRVGTECDPYSSTFVQGTVQTQGCGRIITAGGATYAYLPTQQFYDYSYTQQIYLNDELTGLDTITDIAFHLDPSYTCSGRNIVIYMGNTTQSSFASTGNYIAPANLQQVYSGTLSGNGWISFQLTTPFVRTAGSNLVVAVDDNTGDYTSTIYWTATSTQNARAIYFYQDGTDILPSSPSASSSGAVNYVNQIKLTNATCFIPDCNTPLPTMDTVMERQAIVVWNTETGHTYTVEYRIASDTAWTVADAANTTGTCTLTALSPGMDYVARISTDCNGTLLTGSVNFTTLCAPVDLPYTEDFEDMSGTYARSCWVIGSTHLGTSYPNPTVVSLTGDPNKLCLFYNGGYAIMPRMNAPLNQLQVRFSFLQGGDGVRFLFGLIDDPAAPINTMTVLDTIVRSDYDTVSQTINYTYNFSQLSDADSAKYIAFWDAFNDNYSFIDNLVVEYIPNCQPVTGLTASSVTTSGATVSWQDDNTSATGYYVEYGLHGFTPGTGTGFMETTTTTTLTGLAHSTSYDLYVYTVCGGDTAIASQVLIFSTECDAFTTLPYTNNFEGYVPAGNTATNILPNCWMTENAAAYLYYNTNSLQAPSQSHALYLLGDGIVVLPEMGVSLSQLMVTFHDYKASGYGIIVGAVDVTATGNLANNFEPIDTVIFPGVTNVMDITSVLSDYTGTANHIAFKAFGTTGSGVSHYIDDVTIDYIPNCLAPQRVSTAFLTGYQADLVWRTSQAPSYSLEYGLHGFTPGTGTTLTTTTRSASLTSLTPQTQYDVYLVSLCSASETSDTTLYTFTTACDFVTLPYTQTFETATTGSSTTSSPFGADCMIRLNNGTSYGGYPYISSSSTYNHTSGGSKGLYWYNTTTTGTYGDYQCVVLPPVDPAMGVDTLQFKFWAKASSTSYNPIFQVGVMTDPYDITTFVGVDTISVSGTTWTEFVVPLTTYTGNGMYVALKADRPSSSWYAYVDDLGLEIAPTCITPRSIYSTAASTSTITVDWTPMTPAANWQVEYGPAGYTFGSTAGTRFATAVHPVTLTGLNTLTSYDVYVRPICSATDTGAWSAAATLMTSMCDNSHIVTTATAGSAQSTSYYAPVNNFYRYTLSETIIDSAEIGGPMDIEYLAYYYDYSSAVTDKTNCTVYFQPTTKTVFSSSTDVVAVNSTAVKVYTGDFNFTQGWNYLPLDTTYHYNGLGNLMVIVDDNSNDYNSSSYVYRTRTCNGYKTLTYYSDSYDPDAHSATNLASYSGSKTYYQYRPEMQLISCGYVPSCQAPVITSTTGTYQSATMTWNGTGTAYEVAIKAVSATNWGAEIPVNGNSYTFTGLQPVTPYMLRVRQDCTADTLGYSDWVTTTFVTDSLPCVAPESLAVGNLTNASGTFSWTPIGNEAGWDLHVWSGTGFDSIYTLWASPATVSGFTAGVTYNAAIRALCGDASNIEGEWGDTIQFTTATCPTTTGLTTSNVTYNSITVNWTAVPGAQGYQVAKSYGTYHDTVTTNLTTHTFTGLEPEMTYTFRVLTICAAGWEAESWSNPVSATTLEASGTTYTITAVPNNTAYGRVEGGGTYVENSTIQLTAIAFDHYHFANWHDGVTTTSRSVTVTGDATYTANFAPDQHTLTLVNNNPTMGSVSGNGTYDYNSTVTISATPNAGHHFVAWNDGDTHSVRSIVIVSDTTFTASFAAEQYTVTVDVNDATMGSVTGGGTYSYGETAVLTATANDGYFFRNWSDGNTANPRNLVVTGDITLTANFSDDSSAVTEYTVTLTVNDPTMGTLSTYGGPFAEGTVLTVTATPNAGYHFEAWSDANTDNPRTIVVDRDITLMAIFEQNVGIDEVTEAACSIYPNPAKGTTTVDVTGISGKVRIAVLDLSGREVLSETMECSGDCKKSLDIEGLAEGAYFVRITSETNAPMVKKLIVR